MKRTYDVSFHCYYPGTKHYTAHRQEMPLKDVPKWIEAYFFTHPAVESISVKIWTADREGVSE